MTAEINTLVNQYRRDKWISHLDNCDMGSHRLWSTIRHLSGTNSNKGHIAVAFNDVQQSDAKKCAKKFCQQFVAHPTQQNRTNRSIKRTIKKLCREDTTRSFTRSEVEAAISKAKASKALGPDGIAMLIMKKLGPAAMEYLTQIFNLSIHTLVIPEIWKVARVIPLLKPENQPTKENPTAQSPYYHQWQRF